MKKSTNFLFLLLILLAVIPGKTKAKTNQVTYSSLMDSTKKSVIDFSMLDSVVANYDVFINGENHTYMDANARLWVDMFKYLHKNAGVRNIMIEYGYASGWLINEYIQTGDTNLFNVIKTYAYKQYSNAYKELMEFNKGLDSSDRIYLTGIDLERGIFSAAKVLTMQFPESKMPHDSIALHTESLKSLVSYSETKLFDPEAKLEYYRSYSVTSTFDNIIENFDQNKVHYENYLGEKYQLFERIINGIKDLKTYKQYDEEQSTHQFVFRERYMYKQFQHEQKNHEGKFFGQFGRCHTSKNTQIENSCNWYNFKSLANRVAQGNSDSSEKLKVFTTGIFYLDNIGSDDELKGMVSHFDSIFLNISDDKLVLYDLPNDKKLNSRLNEMFDYIVLCTYESNKEYGAPVTEIDDILNSDPEAKVFLMLSGGITQVDMQPLNNYLGGIGSSNFSNNIPFWSVTIGSKEETLGLHSLGYIGGFLEQSFDINDSTSARTRGFIYKSLTGYDIFRKTSWVDLLGGIGFSYHNLKLDIKKKTDFATPLLGYIGEESISTVNNPAILFDLFSSLEFNIKHFTIGTTFGYSFDLSDPNWIADKRLLSDSPETDLGGMFGSINIGVNFGSD